MKRKNQKVFTLVSRSGIILSTLLLSIGVASVPTRSDASNLTLAQVPTQEQEKLEPRQERLQVQAEFYRDLDRTTTLFNVLLGILVLLLGAALLAL